MDNQKIYDAMLIKAFRADVTLGTLWYWLKPYNINPPDPTLKRQPPIAKMRVQVFVGTFLKPLSDKLWDTDKTHDIKTLYWMDKLDSQNTNKVMDSDIQNLKRKSNNDRRRQGFLHDNLQAQNASNQWKVTK
jgi:hypothetical protein